MYPILDSYLLGRNPRVLNRKLVAILAILALVLVVAACGDDEGEETTTTAAATTTTAAEEGFIVGVSWNNYNEERWAKWDEPDIRAAIEEAGGTYTSTAAGSAREPH